MKQVIEYTGLDKRLAALRKEKGFTLGEVSKGCGLSPGTISDLEHDRHRGTKQLYALAKFYDVAFEWLSTGKGERQHVSAITQPEQPYRQHGYHSTQAGAEIGAEWDKIEGDEYRQLVHDFVFGMVAAQKRAAMRKPEGASPAGPKTATKKRGQQQPQNRLTRQ